MLSSLPVLCMFFLLIGKFRLRVLYVFPLGREDLSKQSKGHHDTSWTAQNKEVSTSPTKTSKDEEDGMDGLDKDVRIL